MAEDWALRPGRLAGLRPALACFFPEAAFSAGFFASAFLVDSAFLAGLFLASACFASALARERYPLFSDAFFGPAIFPILGAFSAPLRTWSCWRPSSPTEGRRRVLVLFFSFSATYCSSLREVVF